MYTCTYICARSAPFMCVHDMGLDCADVHDLAVQYAAARPVRTAVRLPYTGWLRLLLGTPQIITVQLLDSDSAQADNVDVR